jgi:hypothetical protein
VWRPALSVTATFLGNMDDVECGRVPSVQGREGRRLGSDGYDDSVSDISCEVGCAYK